MKKLISVVLLIAGLALFGLSVVSFGAASESMEIYDLQMAESVAAEADGDLSEAATKLSYATDNLASADKNRNEAYMLIVGGVVLLIASGFVWRKK